MYIEIISNKGESVQLSYVEKKNCQYEIAKTHVLEHPVGWRDIKSERHCTYGTVINVNALIF